MEKPRTPPPSRERMRRGGPFVVSERRRLALDGVERFMFGAFVLAWEGSEGFIIEVLCEGMGSVNPGSLAERGKVVMLKPLVVALMNALWSVLLSKWVARQP